MEKEILEKIINESKTFREVLIKTGKSDHSSQYKILHRKIKEFGFNTSHFLSPKEVMKRNHEEKILIKKEFSEIFCENSLASRSILKKRFLEINKNECKECGQNDIWRGKKLTLILDHKNGINNDNRIENLRLLCPNCNGTLDTNCVGFNGVIKREEKNKLKEEKKRIRKIYKPRVNQRKIKQRPSLESLLKDVVQTNYSVVGKKYGVSDNAVRKWIKNYGSVLPKKNKL